MSPRGRLITAVAITALAFAATIVFIAARLEHWDASGWAGVQYMQWFPSKPNKGPAWFGMVPGRIIIAYPDAPASRAGMEGSDVIEAINGIPISNPKALSDLDRRARTGDLLTYRVRRGETARDVRLRLVSPLHMPRIIVSILLSVVVAIAFALIGLVVFIRQPDDRRAVVFYAMAIAGALSFLGGIAISLDASSLRGILTTPGRAMVIIGIYAAVTFAFAALTLHLALVFPHDRPVLRKRPYIVRWIYVIPAFAAVCITEAVLLSLIPGTSAEKGFEFAVGRGFRFIAGALAIAGAALAFRIARKARTEGAKTAFVSRPVQSVLAVYAVLAALALFLEVAGQRAASRLIFFVGAGIPAIPVLAYPVFSFIALYRSYRDSGVEEKRQVKWPLWGTMIAIGSKIVLGLSGIIASLLISFKILDTPAWFGVTQTLELVPRVLYLLIPISFAVAIMKYRLMNIDVIIRKTVAYTILSGFIVFIYLVLVGGLGTVLVNVAGVRNQTMVIASTLVVALLFVPLRNRLQRLVDRNLFRQKYDYPEALRAIAAETLAATDVRTFLGFAAETLQQAVQNQSIVIFERRDDALLATAKVGLPDSVLGSVRMDTNAAEPIDRPLNPRKRALPESATAAFRRIDASLAVPIRTHGVLHGVIALGSKLSDREFDLDDADFLASAADQIGLTIDRIRLQREEDDFEQARQMQQALLPASLPKIEGVDVSGTWKPARAVGGDYYDFLQLSDTQLGVCIGDVAGKGMSAALVMSALQAAVRASAAPDVAPADLCDRVRRVIVQSLAGGRFVTFFYGTIDTAARRIRYCNAGHNPPVLVRADGRAIRLDKGGSALSRLFIGTLFRGGEEELLDGDRLVLFTDGVSEARNEEGTDFGEERLEQIITANRQSHARDLIATIADSVSAWSGGRVEDDLTLVAVAVS